MDIRVNILKIFKKGRRGGDQRDRQTNLRRIEVLHKGSAIGVWNHRFDTTTFIHLPIRDISLRSSVLSKSFLSPATHYLALNF